MALSFKWFFLVVFAVFLLPISRSVELCVVIAMCVGIFDLVKNTNDIRSNKALHWFTVIFLSIWLPSIISVVDAVNFEKSLKTSLLLWRLYFAGVFIISRIRSYDEHLLVGKGIAAVLIFWSLDAWLQQIIGVDIFGFSAYPGRITGVFNETPRLGYTMIPFLGVAIAAAALTLSLRWSVALGLLFISTILISGNRAAWVSLVWMSLCLIPLLWKYEILNLKRFVALSIVGLICVVGVVTQVQSVKDRLSATLVILDGGLEAVDSATAKRGTLWKTAVRMIEDNPINGVGARGFRYAYPDYAGPNDSFVSGDEGTGAFHAHHVILELWADTGVIGVSGYLLMSFFLLMFWRRAISGNALLSVGYGISLIGVFIPFNTHLAMFASYWSTVLWLLLALYFSVLAAEKVIDVDAS